MRTRARVCVYVVCSDFAARVADFLKDTATMYGLEPAPTDEMADIVSAVAGALAGLTFPIPQLCCVFPLFPRAS